MLIICYNSNLLVTCYSIEPLKVFTLKFWNVFQSLQTAFPQNVISLRWNIFNSNEILSHENKILLHSKTCKYISSEQNNIWTSQFRNQHNPHLLTIHLYVFHSQEWKFWYMSVFQVQNRGLPYGGEFYINIGWQHWKHTQSNCVNFLWKSGKCGITNLFFMCSFYALCHRIIHIILV